MKQFSGGVVAGNQSLSISLCIGGGQIQIRSYADRIDPTLSKLNVMTEALGALDLTTEADVSFYLAELTTLFSPVHIDLLYGDGSYQMAHNIGVLYTYVQVCTDALSNSKDTFDTEALQLLGCMRMVCELHTDCKQQLGPVLNRERFQRSYDGPTDVVEAGRALRTAVSIYVQHILDKRTQLQAAYRKTFEQIHEVLAE